MTRHIALTPEELGWVQTRLFERLPLLGQPFLRERPRQPKEGDSMTTRTAADRFLVLRRGLAWLIWRAYWGLVLYFVVHTLGPWGWVGPWLIVWVGPWLMAFVVGLGWLVYYVGLPLVGLYLLVRFVKWAWTD